MWRFYVTVAVLFVGGVLSAAGIIVKKKPNAKELIEKLVPYQGWIGIVMFIWGVWDVFSIVDMFRLLSILPVMAIAGILAVLCELVLGFLLGFGLITKYALSKNEQAMAKGQEIRGKLVKYQPPLGIVAIIVSVYLLLARVFHIML